MAPKPKKLLKFHCRVCRGALWVGRAEEEKNRKKKEHRGEERRAGGSWARLRVEGGAANAWAEGRVGSRETSSARRGHALCCWGGVGGDVSGGW